jgi:hypothetical protein
MYQSIFLGHCFSCTKIGHKSIDCKSYRIKYSLRNRSKIHNDGHATLHYKVQCYKCYNDGHIAGYCTSSMTIFPITTYAKVWKKKQDNKDSEPS